MVYITSIPHKKIITELRKKIHKIEDYKLQTLSDK